MSTEMAATMREDMLGVVQGGTASRMQIPGYEVGGKTGTAQVGTSPPTSHTWIIGFAGPPGQPASVAVAVVVLNQPGNNESTGGVVAAPIARAVMEKVLQIQHGG
jgi:peptidoglycan glycosyltransferase